MGVRTAQDLAVEHVGEAVVRAVFGASGDLDDAVVTNRPRADDLEVLRCCCTHESASPAFIPGGDAAQEKSVESNLRARTARSRTGPGFILENLSPRHKGSEWGVPATKNRRHLNPPDAGIK